ncbi:MAG: DUF2442 domain-containing protein [Micropepsaceae bacterium]
MNSSTRPHSPRAKDVRFTGDALEVLLQDGRKISVPISWFPRLLSASPEDRTKWELSGAGQGIHWPKIDEDLSVQGLLAGGTQPAADNAFFDHSKRTKGFFQEGGALSALWIALFLASWTTDFFGLLSVSAAEFGSLLSGFFAPLALIWFIVALRHQAAELAQNTDALRLQVREMKDAVQESSRQAGALEGNLRFSQIDVMYRMIEMDQDQLSTLANSFVQSIKGFNGPAINNIWAEYSAGNRDAILNLALGVLSESSIEWDPQLRSKAQTNASLLRNYIRIYDALTKNIEQLDQAGAYAAILRDSAASKLRDRAVKWLREWGYS